MSLLRLALLLVSLLDLSLPQEITDDFLPTSCQPGSPIQSFIACNKLVTAVQKCNDVAKDAFDMVPCLCTQDLFNTITDCESEERLCLLNTDFDSSAQELIQAWHIGCDDAILFKPTTPALSSLPTTNALSSLPATLNEDACTSASSSCASLNYEVARCTSSFPESEISSRLSCECQTSVLSLAYECEFVGNVSCLNTNAAWSEVYGYSFCSGFASFFENTTATAATSPASASAMSSGDLSSITAKPSLNGEATTTTTTASSTNAGIRASIGGLSLFYVAIAVFICSIA